jgi:hypothetical protein
MARAYSYRHRHPGPRPCHIRATQSRLSCSATTTHEASRQPVTWVRLPVGMENGSLCALSGVPRGVVFDQEDIGGSEQG